MSRPVGPCSMDEDDVVDRGRALLCGHEQRGEGERCGGQRAAKGACVHESLRQGGNGSASNSGAPPSSCGRRHRTRTGRGGRGQSFRTVRRRSFASLATTSAAPLVTTMSWDDPIVPMTPRKEVLKYAWTAHSRTALEQMPRSQKRVDAGAIRPPVARSSLAALLLTPDVSSMRYAYLVILAHVLLPW